ncbi:hypothetical protein ABK040_000365 [Willaertia magna]
MIKKQVSFNLSLNTIPLMNFPLSNNEFSFIPLPPPPSSSTFITFDLKQVILPTTNDLLNMKDKLKKPTFQHIVDFKERYEMALLKDKQLQQQ